VSERDEQSDGVQYELSVPRIFMVPRAVVSQAFTDSSRLAAWSGPPGLRELADGGERVAEAVLGWAEGPARGAFDEQIVPSDAECLGDADYFVGGRVDEAVLISADLGGVDADLVA
jgi:hypothetical protein